jgi:uncharacterized membrane protein
MAAGIALGFAGAFGGIVAFIIVLVVGAAGFALGYWIDRREDFPDVLGRGRDRDRVGR